MTRYTRIAALAFVAAALILVPWCRGQAALLLEQPYGIYGLVNPTGHNAIYLQRVCAETPVKLRRCRPGEQGSVISRYEGIDGYDWIAMPLIPYLYSLEDGRNVPDQVTRKEVLAWRQRYREAHFHEIGLDRSGGSWVPNGWTQLLGAAYQRRIYAFRFDTTPEQDDELIERLNSKPNRSHFEMLYRNCADFARTILNIYFPHQFRRSIFPDLGITTPKQVTDKLVRYARKHPELNLKVYEIPQVPGFQRFSHPAKNVAESFVTTVYAIPITLISPYITGGLFVDYLVRGRYHLLPKHPRVVHPDDLTELTERSTPPRNNRGGLEPVLTPELPVQSAEQPDSAAEASTAASAAAMTVETRASE